MVQQQIFEVAGSVADISAGKDAVIRFNAETAVRALVFHLLDERVARVVSPDTIERTIQRLKENRIQPSIARRHWIAMTNSQRLRWFLQECHTTTRTGTNETIRLRAKPGR
jgi:hypothetical protein